MSALCERCELTYQVDKGALWMLAFLIDGEVALKHVEGVLRNFFTVGQYHVEAPASRRMMN